MKVRNGFVSNSSSSSFVVAIDENKIPKSMEELREHLECEWKAPIMHLDIQKQMGTLIPVELDPKLELELNSGYLFYQIGTPAERKELDEFDKGYWTESRRIKDEDGEDAAREFISSHYRKMERMQNAIVEKFLVKFIKRNKGKVAMYFEYSDNDGPEGSELEHGGDTFRWVHANGGELVTVSKH